MENLITIEMIDDWAGAAMQGLIAAQGQSNEVDIKKIADISYAVAVEMARARGAFIDEYGDELASDQDEDSGEDDQD